MGRWLLDTLRRRYSTGLSQLVEALARPQQWVLVETPEQFIATAKAVIAYSSPVYFDIETTGLNPRSDAIVSLQLYQWGLPVTIVDMRRMTHLGLVRHFFDVVKHTVIGHNLKFDLGFLYQKFGTVPQRVYDTMIAEQVIFGLGIHEASEDNISFNLRDTAQRYGVTLEKETRNTFIGMDQRSDWNSPFTSSVLDYMSRDVTVLQTIVSRQTPELRARGLLDTAQLEFRALPAIARLETRGFPVKPSDWREVVVEAKTEADRLEDELVDTLGVAIQEWRIEEYDRELLGYTAWGGALADETERLKTCIPEGRKWGEWKTGQLTHWREEHPNPGKPKFPATPPNLGSPVQLKAGLLKMGILVTSTSEAVLAEVAVIYPELETLLAWKSMRSLHTKYGDKLIDMIENNRLYASWQQIGASTGRMSCSKPNLQQIPSKGPLAKKFRQAVKAPPGWAILTADFSNIELRIIAEVSKDSVMLQAFQDGKDLHTLTARTMFKLDESIVDKLIKDPDSDPARKHLVELKPGFPYRAIAKTINFGLAYGMSSHKLSRTLKCTVDEAQEIIDKYFSVYQGLKVWLENSKKQALRKMQSRTPLGRARYYTSSPKPFKPETDNPEEIRDYNAALKVFWSDQARIKRQGTNQPIQGCSADITKEALALWNETVPPSNTEAFLIGVIHDELIVEVKQDKAAHYAVILADVMQRGMERFLKHVPAPAPAVSISDHWEK